MRYQNLNTFNYKPGTNSKGLQAREMDADKVRTERGQRRKARGGKKPHQHEWVMWTWKMILHKGKVLEGRERNEERFYCKKKGCNCTSRTAK